MFEVNFERELLFRKLPASIIFWGDDDLEIAFQRLAPDFWDWLVYRFRFDAVLQPDVKRAAESRQFLPVGGEAWETRRIRLQERLQYLAPDRDKGERHALDYADTTLSLGNVLVRLARLSEARELYDEAIGLYEKEQADLGRANALQSLGDLAAMVENPTNAEHLYRQALGLYQKEQEPVGLINTYIGMARLTHRFGLQGPEQESAKGWHERALAIARQTGVPFHVEFVERAGQELFG